MGIWSSSSSDSDLRHMPLGALPIARYDLMELSSIRVEEEHEEYTSYKIFSSKEIASSISMPSIPPVPLLALTAFYST